jgi:hypothetical protein
VGIAEEIGSETVAIVARHLFYASVGILLLWLASPTEVATILHVRTSPWDFLLYFLDPVLPSTFLCTVAFQLLEAEARAH